MSPCSCQLRITVARDLQLIHDLASLIALLINLALVEDLYLQPFGKGIDNRSAYTVQTAGYLVSPAAELSAGMQDGKYHLQGGIPAFALIPTGIPLPLSTTVTELSSEW